MQVRKRINELAQKNIPWLSCGDPGSDIVVSTRMRLARNISGFLFPGRAEKGTRLQVFNCAHSAIKDMPMMANSIVVRLTALPKIDRKLLFERHLISSSPAYAKEGSGVVISESEESSIIINEEDHLRLQVILPGLQLNETWCQIDQLDDYLSKEINYSYKRGLGFLTSCPTNVGTGLRASVMLHLPALIFNNQMGSVIRALEQMKFTVRGLYGEGSESIGNFFQVSNQSTLGEDETTIVNKLGQIVQRVVELEKNSRKLLLQNKLTELSDYVSRSLGLLTHCYLLSTKEALSELSFVRLGVDLGMFSTLNADIINKLIVNIQSGHIQKHHKKRLSAKQRDMFRAEIVKATLKKFTSQI